jgi:hypothetical protein
MTTRREEFARPRKPLGHLAIVLNRCETTLNRRLVRRLSRVTALASPKPHEIRPCRPRQKPSLAQGSTASPWRQDLPSLAFRYRTFELAKLSACRSSPATPASKLRRRFAADSAQASGRCRRPAAGSKEKTTTPRSAVLGQNREMRPVDVTQRLILGRKVSRGLLNTSDTTRSACPESAPGSAAGCGLRTRC